MGGQTDITGYPLPPGRVWHRRLADPPYPMVSLWNGHVTFVTVVTVSEDGAEGRPATSTSVEAMQPIQPVQAGQLQRARGRPPARSWRRPPADTPYPLSHPPIHPTPQNNEILE